MKPVKRGIKMWALANAANGFRKGWELMWSLHLLSLTSTAFDISTQFFFTVVYLLDLERASLYSCGTIRTNRKGFPTQLKPVAKKAMKERGE